MKRGFVLALGAALVVLAGQLPAFAGKTAAEPSAERPLGHKMADQVLNSKHVAGSVAATRKILALSGVATVREGQQLVAPVAPASSRKVTARETVLMALGARMPQVTLGTMAARLSETGVEVDGQPFKTAFPQMVSQWLYQAQNRPFLPLNQPAQFILRMQSQRTTPRQFAKRYANPAKMPLSALEATIVLANLERVIKPGAPPAEEEDPYYDDEPVARATQEGGPCTKVKAAFDSLGPIGSTAADVVIGEATGSAIDAYADSLKDGAGDKVGAALTALEVADRLWRTYGFAQHIQVIVVPGEPSGDGVRVFEDDRVHKPTNGRRKHVYFIAGVGLDDERRKEVQEQLKVAKDHAFQEDMRACAALHGVTIPKSPYGDLASEMEDWSAYWTPRWRGQEVQWHHPRRSKLKRLDFAAAAAVFKVSIEDESRKVHNDENSRLALAGYNAQVEIAAQKPPSPVSMAKLAAAIGTANAGNAVGPVAEFLESLFRTVAKPTATGTLWVEEHIKDPCTNYPGSGADASC